MFAVLFSSIKYDQSQRTGSKWHMDLVKQRIVTQVSFLENKVKKPVLKLRKEVKINRVFILLFKTRDVKSLPTTVWTPQLADGRRSNSCTHRSSKVWIPPISYKLKTPSILRRQKRKKMITRIASP